MASDARSMHVPHGTNKVMCSTGHVTHLASAWLVLGVERGRLGLVAMRIGGFEPRYARSSLNAVLATAGEWCGCLNGVPATDHVRLSCAG